MRSFALHFLPVPGGHKPSRNFRLPVPHDSNGKSNTIYRDILPHKSKLTFSSEPEGLAIIFNGQPVQTPLSTLSVEGMAHTLGIENIQQEVNDKIYEFDQWEHGGNVSQTIIAPIDDITYTAIFKEITVTAIKKERESLIVYPNPVQHFLMIGNAKESEIKITDLTGKTLQQTTINDRKELIKIDLHLPAGVYILHVIESGRIYRMKILVTAQR